jgi:hypothetical protein
MGPDSMKTFELLDRFELLYRTNLKLADLRRAYIDQDISSIFRLTNANDDLRRAVLEKNLHSLFRIIDNHDTEELRKAVTEQNLHSIFRLLDDEELRKLILEDNTWKLWPVLDRYSDTQFIAAFKNFFVNEIEIDHDCFSRGQLQSKQWLVEELQRTNLNLGTVYLCAGWYATLAVMLFESSMKIDKIRSFDIDPSCEKIAEVFNKPWFTDQWKFKSVTKDIMHIDYHEHWWESWSTANNRMSKPICDNPDTIINTSCEHVENFADWYEKIPESKLVILQSNNYFEINEHVNCSATLGDFSKSAHMTTVLYEGELELEKYTRFMKIGYK